MKRYGRGRQWLMYVVGVLLLLTVAACSSNEAGDKTTVGNGQNDNNQAAAGDQVNNDASEQAPITFTYMLESKFVNWLNDLQWYPTLLSNTNAQIELVDGGSGGDYYSNVDLQVASGKFSDAMIVRQAQAHVYGAQGAFADLRPLIDAYAPNIKQFTDETPDLAKLITDDQGRIFGIPAENPLLSNVTFYRSDLLEAAGISELPQTITAFTDMLRQLKTTFADDPHFYPLTGRGELVMYPWVFDAHDHIDADGQVQGIYRQGAGYNIHAPGFEELLTWMAGMNEEKLLDPEWVAGAITEEAWQTKFLTGRSAVTDDFFTRPVWFMNNGQQSDPDFAVDVLPVLHKNNGEPAKRNGRAQFHADRYLTINAKSTQAESIIRFLDYLYSEEGQTLISYGVEGETFEVVDGEKRYLVDFDTEVSKKLGEPNYGFYLDRLTFPTKVDNKAYYTFLDPFTSSFAESYFNENVERHPALKYTPEQQAERSNLAAKVNEAVSAGVQKFINGSRPLQELAQFRSEMDALGYARIVEIDQQAYDAMFD